MHRTQRRNGFLINWLWRRKGPGAAVVAVALTTLGVACESDPEVPPVPTVSALSASVAEPGDTLVITGRDFRTQPGQNTVIFNNGVGTAKPFAAAATRLQVVVPAYAATGPVSVVGEGNPAAGVGPRLEVTHALGEVWIWQGSSGLKLPSPTPGAEYLVIPHATNPARPFSERFDYTVTASQDPAYPAPPGGASVATERLRKPGQTTLADRFHARMLERARQLPPARGAPRPAPSIDGTPAQSKEFFVFNGTGVESSPSSYTLVQAELRYAGDSCLVYADIDTQATGNLSDADFQNFADQFDNTFSPNNRTFFGTESDLDGNGKVIILVTPVVNLMTPPGSTTFIGGFFNPNDLLAAGSPGAPAGTTNHGEVLYVLAADPTGTWNNVREVAKTVEENLKTIVHEYEHLISISHRWFHERGAFQLVWLEEGMAHMAEDLSGINTGNVTRAGLYLADPGAMTLEYNLDPPVEQRGAAYLFLRYLGDRFGGSIYSQIVQSMCAGRACVEAITGESFFITVADWLATLYLSGRGINTSDKYNYQSIDLGNFTPLRVQGRVVDGVSNMGRVMRSTGDYYLFSNPATEASVFVFAVSSNARLRAVIVRTQ